MDLLRLINEYKIDYQAVVDDFSGLKYQAVLDNIAPLLEDRWCEAYLKMTPADNCIDIISLDTFNYVYDNPSTISKHEFIWGQDVEDRAVAVYGTSVPIKEKRDLNRMRCPRGEREWGDTSKDYPYDRGHYIAHCIGGQADLGLFPQRSDINRGTSSRGRIFRSMERYCLNNPGIFCFSRPIYLDKSDHPFYLEFGILKPDLTFWVELFENRYLYQQS